ncbi:MAG: tetratricopeptide repeat protein [Elusimicrobiota bacterium]|nr:MAG: tetratricopeptide repeat protein [Elusimicrobiota bacterium]
MRALALAGGAGDRRRLASVLRARAEAELAAGRLDGARHELERLLAVLPGDASARRALAAVLRRKGLAHVSAGRLAAAEKSLRRALALAPRDSGARRGLADVARIGRLSAAARRAEEKRAKSQKVRRLRAGGLASVVSGNLARAEDRLRRALKAGPGDRESWRQLSEVIAMREQARGARERAAALRKAEALRGLLEAMKNSAQAYSPAERTREARRFLKRALAVEPGHARALLIAGGILAANGAAAEGRRLLRRALAAGAGALGGGERFTALMRLGRHRAAVAEAERILRGPGPSVDDLRAFWDPWEWDPARTQERRRELARLERALPRGAANPWALYYRADLHDPDEESVLLRVAALPRARYGWMLAKAGLSDLIAGRFARAAARLRAGLAHRARDWRTRGLLAEALLCLGRTRAAYAELDRALPEAPAEEKGQVHAWRGLLRLWRGEYAEALRLFEEALTLGAPYAAAWRGAALLKLGRPKEALAQLDAALAKWPLDLEAYVWRAETKRALGLPREALSDLAEPGLAGRGRETPVWLWALVNRALAKGELGDAAGLEADYALLPRAVREHLEEKAGPGGPRDRLLAALELARGYRREEYRQAIWMT